MNMKNKKEVIKQIFAANFTEYYKSEPNFVYLMFVLLAQIKDEKLIGVTLLKNLRLNYQEFFKNVDLAKLFLLFLHQNFQQRIAKEKIFVVNDLTESFIDLKTIFNDEQFKKNVNYLSTELVQETLLKSHFTSEQLNESLNKNSFFSLLFSTLFIKLAQNEKNLKLINQLLMKIMDILVEEVEFPKLSDDGFVLSSNGQRFIKSLIQKIPLYSETNKKYFEEFIGKLMELIRKKPEKFLLTRGSFILVAIIENSEHGEDLKQFLKSCELMKRDDQGKGFKLLKTLL